MLVQLTISDFAIINHLEIEFRPGLNILSGETGAGKSIIINALNLILGGRASADLIRSGSREARVEALFRFPEGPHITKLLSDFDIPFNGELLVKRTISHEGRNKIMINGSIATLQNLARIGIELISISGQHEHQLLLKPENHLYLLDDFGGLNRERQKLAEVFTLYQSQKERLHRLEKEIADFEEQQELRRFQVKEIKKAGLKKDEDNMLEDEKSRLRHAEQLLEIIAETYQMLYESEGSVLSDISLCVRRMEKGVDMDRRLKIIGNTLESVRVELEDVALELRDVQKTITIDPVRLEDVEERLLLINRLKRKYGHSIEDIMEFKDKVSGEIGHLEKKNEELLRINKRLEELEKDLAGRAYLLSRNRKKEAQKLEKSMGKELQLLDMQGTSFKTRFQQDGDGRGNNKEIKAGSIRAEGYDIMEFMLSPNEGEELRPLSRIASGGELSRIMLAMKTILARAASVETSIFDEVDSGIGGATAEVVGEKLFSLADYQQVLCITHLPQIACKGKNHFLVKKGVKDSRTQTTISELGKEERVDEIARLLGGKVISRQAMAHAREMLK